MKKRHDAEHMSVVFATYHSIDVIHDAQKHHGLADFDLIVCDEAHRTTGATFEGEDESHFVKVHDAATIRGKKRLYMTATPRIYGDSAKATAERDNVALCSMDDVAMYGENLYLLTFSEAVKRGLLVDYKVIVLAVDESHVSRRLQSLLKDDNNQLRVDDAAKIIGCWKALAKQGLSSELSGDTERDEASGRLLPGHRAPEGGQIAQGRVQGHRRDVPGRRRGLSGKQPRRRNFNHARCEAEHVDGGMNATEKDEKISWLKASVADGHLPHPQQRPLPLRGRRRARARRGPLPHAAQLADRRGAVRRPRDAEGAGQEARLHRAPGRHPGRRRAARGPQRQRDLQGRLAGAPGAPLARRQVRRDDQQARSHRERPGEDGGHRDHRQDREARDRRRRDAKSRRGEEGGGRGDGAAIGATPDRRADLQPEQRELEFEIGEIERAIYAKLVQKVGNRHHWEDWAKDIAKIARTHIDRITGILENKANTREREAFDRFADELRDDLNDSITRDEIIEMLAQHLVTKPVFDALFAGRSFAAENSMSRAMQGVLDALHEHHIDKEASTLEKFYESVKLRARASRAPRASRRSSSSSTTSSSATRSPRCRSGSASSTRRSRSSTSS